MVNPFRRLWAAGYRSLLPIVPPDAKLSFTSTLHKRLEAGKDPRGKTPGIKRLDGNWSSWDWLRHVTTEAELDTWHLSGAGIGLALGRGQLALDVDTLDKPLAEKILRIVAEIIPGAHAVRFGRAPKYLTLFACDDPDVPYTRVEFTGHAGKNERVELLGRGRQCVVEGIHPGTGKPYSWRPAMPAASDLVKITRGQIDALFSRLAKELPAATEVIHEGAKDAPDQRSLTGDYAAVKAAIAALPNTSQHFPTRDSYRDVGYALKASLPGREPEAFALYAEWCERWTGPDGEVNDPGVVAADWSRMRAPYKVGANWLFEKLETCGGPSIANVWFDEIAEEPKTLFDLAPEEEKPRRQFELTHISVAAGDAMSLASRPLIKGFLDCGAMTVLYGPSNVGKTFLAMDIAFAIACGRAWAGKKTLQAAVVYIAAEGGVGARKRAKALGLKFGVELDAIPFYFRLAPVDLFRADADLEPAIAAINEIPNVGLVVIDTTSRALAGADENSPVDMGTYVKNIDRLRALTKAHVFNVHHSGKDIARGARGWSGLRAATDTEIEIIDGRLKVEKQREIETNFETAFKLEVVTLGHDADGDPVTSCTVKLTDGQFVPPAEVERASGSEQAVLDVVRALETTNDNGSRGARQIDIINALSGRIASGTVKPALRRLALKGHIMAVGRGLWVTRAVPAAETIDLFD